MRSRVSTPTGPRVATIESTARALGRAIAAHNRQVLLIAAFTFLVAALLWAVLYAVCCWAMIFVLAVADTPRFSIPRGFGVVFAVAALCSAGYAWLDSHLKPNASARDDKGVWEIAGDFLLALPRITLAIGGTLRAWLALSLAERRMAAEFLHRLRRERRVPMHTVPLGIPGEPQRFRILFALQILRVIEIRRDENQTLITLDSQHPRSLFAA